MSAHRHLQKVMKSWISRLKYARWRAKMLRTLDIIHSVARRKLVLISVRRERRLLNHAAVDVQRVWKGSVHVQAVSPLAHL